MSKVSTGVSATFSASHYNAAGALHGHDYKVTVWFPAGDDALYLQSEVRAAVAPYNHSVMPEDLATAENIAERLLRTFPTCLSVRPLLGLYARAER